MQQLILTIDLLETYLSDRTETFFVSDHRSIITTCFNLKIIGECASSIPSSVRERHPELPWIFLRNLRNPIANTYYRNDPRITWLTLHNRIYPLAPIFAKIIESDSAAAHLPQRDC